MTLRCYSAESDIATSRTGVAVERLDPADDERRQLNELFQRHVDVKTALRRRSQPTPAVPPTDTDRRSLWQRVNEAMRARE